MFKFGKKKRYTIGEKITYFNSIIKNKSNTLKRRNWAKQRKSQLVSIKDNMELGDVFVVDDNLMGNPKHKPRVVVVAEVKKDKVVVAPVRRSGKIVPLSKFDNNRVLRLDKAKKISKYRLFEKRGFKVFKNAILTPHEKDVLQKKSKIYIR